MNLYDDIECLMCDEILSWNDLYDNWVHAGNKSVYCKGKVSVATPKNESTEEDE